MTNDEEDERLIDIATRSVRSVSEDSYRAGAAAAFGLMGMAQAIRDNPRTPLVVERHYWTAEDETRHYDCFCPGCGCGMKNLKAGEHEGTDREWCGQCLNG